MFFCQRRHYIMCLQFFSLSCLPVAESCLRGRATARGFDGFLLRTGGLKRHDSRIYIYIIYPCLPFLAYSRTYIIYISFSRVDTWCVLDFPVYALAGVRHAPTPGALPFRKSVISIEPPLWRFAMLTNTWPRRVPSSFLLRLRRGRRRCGCATRVYILFEGTWDTRRHAPGPFHLREYCASVENLVFSFVFRVVDGRRYESRCTRLSLLASRFIWQIGALEICNEIL